MADLEFNRQEIEDLARKLSTLEPRLSEQERALARIARLVGHRARMTSRRAPMQSFSVLISYRGVSVSVPIAPCLMSAGVIRIGR